MIPDKFKNLLELLKSKLESDFSEAVGMQCVASEEIKWSKGPGFSILPYGLELSGVTPSPILSSEPKNKKIALSFIARSRVDFTGRIYMV